MTNKIIVFVTCATAEQATQIAEAVVREKLVACVNIIPGARSCYTWKEKLTWSEEVLCLMKTTRARFEELRARLKELHSYSVPEIVAVQIEALDPTYADWIDASLIES